ncbi:MAG: hypothetical protein AABX29_07590 [Nanoarchaeota archaeon]
MSKYILLPEDKDRPDILVVKHRLSIPIPGIRLAGKYLGLDLTNNDQGFVGNFNNQQALDLTTRLNGFALFPGYFAEFLGSVRQGITDRSKRPYDEKGKKVDMGELKLIDSDITEQRGPWRGEHLDARFDNEKMIYHKFVNGKLVPVEEPLEGDTLMRDRQIDLDGWLKNYTRQGLARASTQDGGLAYWPPTANSVARFVAFSDGAVLGCNRDPLGSFAEIGVRVARAKI